MLVTRTESFSAAHRLHSAYLSEQENKELYGKCNHHNGHGHNYKVSITVEGPVDETTGMVINLVELKECIWKYALDGLDHRNIDKDIHYFERGIPSTAENVARYIWDQLVSHIPAPARLYEVELHETDKNYVIYRGS